jgi:uncharacterized protein
MPNEVGLMYQQTMQQILEDAFIAKLSGIAEYKNEKEIWWKESNLKFTIEFLNDSVSNVILRSYYYTGIKREETNYKNGKVNGKHISWYQNGQKFMETNYKNDKMHGKRTIWFGNGIIESSEDYINGIKQ